MSSTYRSTRNVLFSCKDHVVWCPKYRRSVLVDGADEALRRIVERVCLARDADLIGLEVMPDHVHLLVDVDPQYGIHRLIKKIKGTSSRELRHSFPFLKRRLPTLWTNSYFVSTVGGAVLGDGLKALALMRESNACQAARLMPKGKERTEAFKACNQNHGFTEYALQALATQHKNAAGFDNRLGAHETQKIASRVFASLQEYAFGQRGRPRFKGKNRPLHSMEGKSNAAGPRWHADTGTLSWGKGFVMPVLLPSNTQDPYIHECLQSKTKYCRIVWRMEGRKRRWFVQLVQDGVAPAKYEFFSSGQVAGLDIGPSTVAIAGDSAVGLEKFAPSVVQPWRQMRTLQRAQDRSRRAMNPDHFHSDGTIKRGPKRWSKSGHYARRQHKLADLERRLAAARKRDHGELANRILGLGNVIIRHHILRRRQSPARAARAAPS